MNSSEIINQQKAAKIAALNDEHRRRMDEYVVTSRAIEMYDFEKEILTKVRSFSDFTEDNDPYGEHDFGAFTVGGVKLFWKIDYYDAELKAWCDPLSPECNRVLTIMLAEEY